MAARRPWECQRLYPEQTITIIGSGPSLTLDDIATVYLAQAARHTKVIAINSTFRSFPCADVLHGGDAAWWNANPDALEFPGLKTGLNQVGAEPWPAEVNKLNHRRNEGIETEPWLVSGGTNSGHQAINIAVHLGAAKIVLLGFDFSAGPGGRSHHHGDHPAPLKNPCAVSMARWLRLIETTAEPLRGLGIDIVNCSRRTAIPCFRRGDIAKELFPA